MKSLEKERARRYETANGLARDIRRYLHDEPIEARPPSLAYKLSKLARRNTRALATTAVFSICVVAVLAMVAGSIGWSVRDRQTRQAVVERKILLNLDEAKAALLKDDLTGAQAAFSQAEGILGTTPTRPEIQQRVSQAKAELTLVQQLEDVQRQRAVSVKDDDFDFSAAGPAYQQAFEKFGLDLLTVRPLQAAEQVRLSPVRQWMVAALDDWADVADESTRAKLLDLSRGGHRRLAQPTGRRAGP